MSTELRGKVKEPLWNRPICTDDSEPLSGRRLARQDFKKGCRGDEEGSVDVASPDVIAEAYESSEPYTD